MEKKRNFNKLLMLVLVLPLLFLTACADSETGADNVDDADNVNGGDDITVAEIEAAQMAWGEGLVGISTAFAEDEDYVAVAVGVLEDLYGYEYGPVLFKPTLARYAPFRFDWDGAASYFIGTSAPESIDEDASGFATSVWTAVNFEDDWQFIINGETAIGMGTVVLTDGDDEETTVHKSLGWFRGSDGQLRLELHHSSLPFGE